MNYKGDYNRVCDQLKETDRLLSKFSLLLGLQRCLAGQMNSFDEWFDKNQVTLSDSMESYERAYLEGVMQAIAVIAQFNWRTSEEPICQDCASSAVEEIVKQVSKLLQIR